ncbi:MAG: hypothetical protein V4710_21535, partial [Verrucomicrobiota bacterium]
MDLPRFRRTSPIPSAAIATLGLTYNTAFRIRFNQYGRGSIPFGSSSPGGIAIDDIEIVSAANPFALRLTMPVRVTEGGSAQAATVSLPAAVSAETV